MKKSADILRLPVISISEGKQVGTVKDLVIDASQGAVVALVVDDGSWYLGAKVLPFNAITGLGESAVTVEGTSNLIPVSTLPRIEQLMAAGVKVIGTRTLTRAGQMGGKVVEISIDETGRINTCEVEESIGERILIPVQQIVTFGKDVLIISEAVDPTGRGTMGMRTAQANSYGMNDAAPLQQAAPAAAATDDVHGDSLEGSFQVAPGMWMYQMTTKGLAAELTATGTRFYVDNDLNKTQIPAVKE